MDITIRYKKDYNYKASHIIFNYKSNFVNTFLK